MEELKPQGVVGCTNITIRSDTGDLRKTSTFILTFHSATPPKYIYVADYIRVPIAPYIPNPLRCFSFQKFGHGHKNCKGNKVCARCAMPDHDSDHCTNQPKCADCKGEHPAYSKECPSWLRERKVQQVKAENGVSFIEVRRLVQSQLAIGGGQSFAAAVSSKNQMQSVGIQCVTIGMQTERTWPSS